MSAQLTDEEALNRVASYCSTAEHCRAEINEKLQRWGIAYETIVAAKNGDTEAICEILRHYERYICHFAKRTVYDADGYPHSIIDDNRRKQIEAEYLSVLLLHYDPNRLPKGETLEQ